MDKSLFGPKSPRITVPWIGHLSPWTKVSLHNSLLDWYGNTHCLSSLGHFWFVMQPSYFLTLCFGLNPPIRNHWSWKYENNYNCVTPHCFLLFLVIIQLPKIWLEKNLLHDRVGGLVHWKWNKLIFGVILIDRKIIFI